MAKGTLTLEDAQLIHEFSERMQPVLRRCGYNDMLRAAKTVNRISYCAIAEARMNARTEHHFFDDPYTTEVASE